MNLIIDPKIFEQFPGVMVGIIRARGIDNSGADKHITALLREHEQSIRATFVNKAINDHPAIAPWREAYRKFGAKPSDYPSSIENLVRRILKGESVRHINNLVDIYNAISLKYLLPVGGEDIAAVKGDIHLTFAQAAEAPVKLLGEPEARPPKLGEVIYKDDLGTLCRRWNWKEAERTKLTEQTTNAILVIEALAPTNRATLEQALVEFKQLIEVSCGGTLATAILDKELKEFTNF